MADVAASVSKVAHGPFVLADLEPTAPESAPAWAGSTKSGWHGPKETGTQHLKNSDTACQKGYDAAKKVSGIKRHHAVDRQGFAHALAVTTAEMTDRKGALFALQQEKPSYNRCNVYCVKAAMLLLR